MSVLCAVKLGRLSTVLNIGFNWAEIRCMGFYLRSCMFYSAVRQCGSDCRILEERGEEGGGRREEGGGRREEGGGRREEGGGRREEGGGRREEGGGRREGKNSSNSVLKKRLSPKIQYLKRGEKTPQIQY